jgi:DHA1 family tetracycline resistance protein-like MFS transporter
VSNKKAQLGIIFFTVFIDLIGFGIVIPILPLYAKHFGVNELVNGILVGSYSGMQFVFAPILGKLSDRFGRRPVLLVSILGTSIGFAIMGFAHNLALLLGTGTLTWLFIARIVDGISGGNIATAQAYIADITAPEDRSRAMGMIGAAFGLGFMFGPALGGVLSQVSIALPFLVASGLALFNVILAYFRLPESLSKEHRATPAKKVPISEVFRHGWHLPTLMGCYFFSITGFAIMTTNYALFTNKRFGYNQAQNGYVFFLLGFLGILIQGGLLRPLLKRTTEKSLAVLGVIFLIAGMAYLPLVTSFGTLILASALVGIGNSFVTPTINGLASRSAERSWQGRVIGLMQSSGSLARLIGPILAGALLTMDVGHSLYGRTPFWAASGILCIALVLTLTLPAKPITAGA